MRLNLAPAEASRCALLKSLRALRLDENRKDLGMGQSAEQVTIFGRTIPVSARLANAGGSSMWWARQDSNLQPDRYERRDNGRRLVDFTALFE